MEKNTYCHDLVYKFDPDRFMITLYAPEDKREGLYALYAFNYELSIIGSKVSEPMLGEIRLQWWRDVINDIFKGTVQSHDIVPSLARAIDQYHLPQDMFIAMIDGRTQDMYNECPENMRALEQYISQTAGTLSCLAARILGGKDCDPLAHALGMAWGYVGIIRSIPYQSSLGKSHIPQEIILPQTKDEAIGGDSCKLDLITPSPDRPEIVIPVVMALSQKAEEHVAHLRGNKKQIPPEARSVFLLSALARRYLKIIKKAGFNPFVIEEKSDAFFRQLSLLTAALFNRI